MAIATQALEESRAATGFVWPKGYETVGTCGDDGHGASEMRVI